MTDEVVESDLKQSGLRQWLLIGIAIGAFVFALYVGTRVIGALMGVLSPPMPPLPPSGAQISQQIDTYGYERWVYEANSFPDSVLAFFEANNVTCESAPFSEARTRELRVEFTDASDLQAYCTGEQAFDPFRMRWAVLVSSTNGSTRTRLDVVRYIDWFASPS